MQRKLSLSDGSANNDTIINQMDNNLQSDQCAGNSIAASSATTATTTIDIDSLIEEMDSLIINDATIATSTNVNVLSNDDSLHRYETNIKELTGKNNNDYSHGGILLGQNSQ